MMIFLKLILNFNKKKIKNILFGYDDFLKLILNLNKIKVKNIQSMHD